MKFVHASDLHLDSPLRGLERYEGAPAERIRAATRRAFENLIELCIEERAELLVIAGDVHDGDWRDYATGLFFAKQLVRLRDAGVRVAWIRGNHDAASKITKKLGLPGDWVFELPSNRPGTLCFEELGVAVHGQSYDRPDVVDDLARHYPEPRAGLFNIGLHHTCLDGRPGHAAYAPCRLRQLVDRGYDYWALGHVHAREVLHREPWVVFSGNLQGRHARELGPKGASLVSVEHDRVVSVEHRALDVVRWHRAELGIDAFGTPDEVLEALRIELERAARDADDRLLAARVTIRGRGPAHAALQADLERWTNQIRQLSSLITAGEVWLEKIEIATEAALDPGELGQRDDVVGDLARSFQRIRGSADELAWLARDLGPLLQELPPELRAELGDLGNPEALAELVDQVEAAILPRVLAEGVP